MTKLEKIRLLDRVMVETNKDSPRSQLIDTEDWVQIITPDAKHSSANAVFRSRLNSSSLAKKIEETLELYEQMRVPYRWLITPMTEPSETESLLEKKGMALSYEATAMMAEAKTQLSFSDPAVSVRAVDRTTADIYLETFISAWELPAHQVDELKSDFYKSLELLPKRFLPFVAYRNEEPVGTSILLNVESGTYLAAGTVKSSSRGRGIYRAMVAHRAKIAQTLGHEHLLIHAKKLTSAPICTKLGFESVYDYRVLSKELKC